MNLRRRLLRFWEEAGTIAHQERVIPILFMIEAFAATLLPLPVALLMVGLVTAAPDRWSRFAFGATAGSAVGGLVLYGIGFVFFGSIGQPLIGYYGAEARWAGVVEWFNSPWGVGFLVIAGITTGLFRVSTLAAGFSGMNPLLFIPAMVMARGFRWYAEAWAIRYAGEKVRQCPSQYYRYAGAGIAIVAIAVFVAVLVARG